MSALTCTTRSGAGRAGRILRLSGTLLLASLALIPLGCGGGGGGGGGSTPATSGTLRLRVNWPAQTRALPTAADSLRIVTTVQESGGQREIDSRTLNRTQAGAYTEEVTLPNVPFASYRATMTAFDELNSGGAVLGTGTRDVQLTSQAATQTINLDTSVNSVITRLELTGGRTGNPLNVAFPLTVSAFNGDAVVPTLPAQFTWSSSDEFNVRVNAEGSVTGNLVKQATITVTDRDSGRTASRIIQSGCPLVLNINVSGTSSEMPFFVNENDDALLTARTGKTGSPTVFNWVGNPESNAFTRVTLEGRVVELRAQPTYGTAQFVRWEREGAAITDSPLLGIDPRDFNNLTVTAVYTSRAAGPDGFTPNYLAETNPTSGLRNQVVRWGSLQPKVTFVTADNFTTQRKARAIEGLDWWKRASGGQVNYTLLADNDTANADVIVCFTGDPFSANCRPDLFQPGLVPVPRGQNPGNTFFMVDPAADPAVPVIAGVGKRVVQIYITEENTLPAVAAHELGHAYGINGHSEDGADLMFPVGDEIFPSGRDVNTLLTVQERSRKVSLSGGSAAGRSVVVP